MTNKAGPAVPLVTDEAVSVPPPTEASSTSIDTACERVPAGSGAEPAGASAARRAQPEPTLTKEAGPTAREMSGWAMAGSAAA